MIIACMSTQFVKDLLSHIRRGGLKGHAFQVIFFV